MSWTKQQIIEQAFDELALAGFTFDLDPDQMESALRRLDTMMALWSSKGIAIGYLLPSSPDESDIGSDSGIPDTAVEAVYMNLAQKLAASRGKTLTAETKLAAKQGYDALLGAAARAAARQAPMPNTMPRGAGNKPWRGGAPFFSGETDTLDTASGDPITT
jgi:hypothetical protein